MMVYAILNHCCYIIWSLTTKKDTMKKLSVLALLMAISIGISTSAEARDHNHGHGDRAYNHAYNGNFNRGHHPRYAPPVYYGNAGHYHDNRYGRKFCNDRRHYYVPARQSFLFFAL